MFELIIFEGVLKTVLYCFVGLFGTIFSIKKILALFFSIILFEIEVVLDLYEYKVAWLLIILLLRNTGKELICERKNEDEDKEKGYEI